MENREDSFSYRYSAEEQAEVEHIREKYVATAENKMTVLRKLDRIPYQKAQTWSLVSGIVGVLILGTGMSLAMTELGAALGSLAMILGIAVGLVGMVLVAMAYPVYNHILKKQRQKIAPEILRLTAELLK